MKKEKKLSKAEEVKTEESGVKLTDEELEQVDAGAIEVVDKGITTISTKSWFGTNS